MSADPSRIQAENTRSVLPGTRPKPSHIPHVPLANLTKASYNTDLTKHSMNNASEGNAAVHFLHITLEVQS